MNDPICMVCKQTTSPDPDWCRDDVDLCADCKDGIVNDFRRLWGHLTPGARAVNAARMRLDNYKEAPIARFFCPLCGSVGTQLNSGDRSLMGECSKCNLYFSVGYNPIPAPFEPRPDDLDILKRRMESGEK